MFVKLHFILLLSLLCVAFISCAGQNHSPPKNGWFRTYYPDGTLETEIRYENGVRVSPIKYYYPSGKLHTFVDTAGNYRQYFEDGTLAMEFTEKNGEKIGDEKIYYTNGNLNSVLKYREDGECFRRDDYDRNGKMKSSCKIFHDPKSREVCETFDSAGVARKTVDDDGHDVQYHPNGNKKMDQVYHGDTLVEEREYYPSGKIMEVYRFDRPFTWKTKYVAVVSRIKYYENGNMSDSCYVEKSSKWDGETNKGLVHICKTFYDNGKVQTAPVYLDGCLVQSYEYYPSGTLKEHQVYDGDCSGKNIASARYYTNGNMNDTCFRAMDQKFCSVYYPDGKPMHLRTLRDSSWREEDFYENGKMRSLKESDKRGSLFRMDYDENGMLRDSCRRVRIGGKDKEICNYFDVREGVPTRLERVHGDTLIEEHYYDGWVRQKCTVVWKDYDDETRICLTYKDKGELRDSSIIIRKRNFSSSERFGFRDERTLYAKDVYREEGDLRIYETESCEIVDGVKANCKVSKRSSGGEQ